MNTSQPCLIVRSEDGTVKDCSLIIEKKVICKVDIDDAIFTLFSSFYVFNVTYPIGCFNFYSLFEHFFLKKKIVGRKPRLGALLADLSK